MRIYTTIAHIKYYYYHWNVKMIDTLDAAYLNTKSRYEYSFRSASMFTTKRISTTGFRSSINGVVKDAATNDKFRLT